MRRLALTLGCSALIFSLLALSSLPAIAAHDSGAPGQEGALLAAAPVAAWVAPYPNGEATGLAVHAAGNVYVTGYSYVYATSRDYATIKYDIRVLANVEEGV